MNSDTRENTGTVQLGNAVWHRFLVLIPLAIALVAVCYFHIRAEGATFEAFSWYQAKEATERSLGDVSMGREGVVEATAAEITGLGFMHVSLHALGDGATTVTAGRGNDAWTWDIEVRDGVVIEDGINFSGWKAIHLSLVVMSGATCALFASVFFQLWKNTWYGYKMVASGAGMLFTFFHFLLFFLYYAHALSPWRDGRPFGPEQRLAHPSGGLSSGEPLGHRRGSPYGTHLLLLGCREGLACAFG